MTMGVCSLARWAVFGAAMIAAFWAHEADAHRPGESYVYLSVLEDEMTGEFHVRVEDMNKVFPLDNNRDGRIADDEVVVHQGLIAAYMANTLEIAADGRSQSIETGELSLFGPAPERQIIVPFTFPTLEGSPTSIVVEHRFLYDEIDPNHTAMLLQAKNFRLGLVGNEAVPSLVFGVGYERQELSLMPPTAFALFVDFLRHGMRLVLDDPFRWALAFALFLPLGAVRAAGSSPPVWEGSRSAADYSTTAAVHAAVFAAAFALATYLAVTMAIDLGRRTEGYFVAASLIILAVDNIRPIAFAPRAGVVALAGVLQGFGPTTYAAARGLYQKDAWISAPSYALGAASILLLIGIVLVSVLATIRWKPSVARTAMRVAAAGVIVCAVAQFTIHGVL